MAEAHRPGTEGTYPNPTIADVELEEVGFPVLARGGEVLWLQVDRETGSAKVWKERGRQVVRVDRGPARDPWRGWDLWIGIALMAASIVLLWLGHGKAVVVVTSVTFGFTIHGLASAVIRDRGRR